MSENVQNDISRIQRYELGTNDQARQHQKFCMKVFFWPIIYTNHVLKVIHRFEKERVEKSCKLIPFLLSYVKNKENRK